MTNKEINELIKNNESSDFLKKKINLTLNKCNVDISLNAYNLYVYIRKQNKGWGKIDKKLPPILSNSRKYFNDFLNDFNDILNEKNTEYYWENTIKKNYLSNHSYYAYKTNEIFTFDSPITSFLIELNSVNESQFNGAYNYLFDGIDKNEYSNKNYFIGIQKAYEFENQDPDKKNQRIRNERSNLSLLRNDYTSFITNSDKVFLEKSNEYDNLVDKNSNEFEDWFNNIKIKEKNRFNESSTNYEEQEINYKKRVEELENLYSNKLMLSKPAEYWGKRASTLKLEANKWLSFLSLSIIIAVFILLSILFEFSDNSFLTIFSNIGSGIKWSILLISIISFLAFALKIFSKLSLSSYHLARDAEERKQLVYVYLSLLNENAISENERIIILQSLFSRSDTGLLKEDSSPTMPSTNIIEKVIKNN